MPIQLKLPNNTNSVVPDNANPPSGDLMIEADSVYDQNHRHTDPDTEQSVRALCERAKQGNHPVSANTGSPNVEEEDPLLQPLLVW